MSKLRSSRFYPFHQIGGLLSLVAPLLLVGGCGESVKSQFEEVSSSVFQLPNSVLNQGVAPVSGLEGFWGFKEAAFTFRSPTGIQNRLAMNGYWKVESIKREVKGARYFSMSNESDYLDLHVGSILEVNPNGEILNYPFFSKNLKGDCAQLGFLEVSSKAGWVFRYDVKTFLPHLSDFITEYKTSCPKGETQLSPYGGPNHHWAHDILIKEKKAGASLEIEIHYLNSIERLVLRQVDIQDALTFLRAFQNKAGLEEIKLEGKWKFSSLWLKRYEEGALVFDSAVDLTPISFSKIRKFSSRPAQTLTFKGRGMLAGKVIFNGKSQLTGEYQLVPRGLTLSLQTVSNGIRYLDHDFFVLSEVNDDTLVLKSVTTNEGLRAVDSSLKETRAETILTYRRVN